MTNRLLMLLAGAALCAGCASRPPVSSEPAAPAGGAIVRYNPRAHYVVAECSVLPSPGEEATVWRVNQIVGRIRFTGESRPPYAIAVVVAGQALAGDRWQMDDRSSPAASEAQP